jgi:hypothetical protein
VTKEMKRIIIAVVVTSLLWMGVIGWFVHRIWSRTGFYIPPRNEDMTYDAKKPSPFPTNVNLHLEIYNQTFREVDASIVLDESIISGAAIIRDQHFGSSVLALCVPSGKHTARIVTMGANNSKPYEFIVEPGQPRYVTFELWSGKSHTNVIYKVRNSTEPGCIF